MDVVSALIVTAYALGAIVAFLLLIYFAILRIEAKRKEDFEDRDN